MRRRRSTLVLIIIVPGGITGDMQIRLFEQVLDTIEPMPDLINKVVQVFRDGRVEIQDWPEPLRGPAPSEPA